MDDDIRQAILTLADICELMVIGCAWHADGDASGYLLGELKAIRALVIEGHDAES